jgi:acyl-CoA hydrolase
MTTGFWNLQRPKGEPADPNVPKTIAESATVTSRMMEILDSNAHGNVHGGVILRMVDESAAIVALKHCRRSVVTARIDQMNFLAPAYIGEVVTLKCALNYVGRTSMEVGVEVLTESPRTGEIRLIGTSQVVFVALDENRQPVPVPPLKATTPDEERQIALARARRERLRQMDAELKRMNEAAGSPEPSGN